MKYSLIQNSQGNGNLLSKSGIKEKINKNVLKNGKKLNGLDQKISEICLINTNYLKTGLNLMMFHKVRLAIAIS